MLEKDYPGLNYGTEKHMHGEMDNVLRGIVKAVIQNKNQELTPVWKEVVSNTLDVYLGKVPKD